MRMHVQGFQGSQALGAAFRGQPQPVEPPGDDVRTSQRYRPYVDKRRALNAPARRRGRRRRPGITSRPQEITPQRRCRGKGLGRLENPLGVRAGRRPRITAAQDADAAYPHATPRRNDRKFRIAYDGLPRSAAMYVISARSSCRSRGLTLRGNPADGPRRHCVDAVGRTLSLRRMQRLDQGQ
jgi:hypothetical protein